MKALHIIAFVLLIIGGLNWGLMGIGGYMDNDWNVVNLVLGSVSWLENLVYLLVGLSALLLAFSHKKDCHVCATPASGGM